MTMKRIFLKTLNLVLLLLIFSYMVIEKKIPGQTSSKSLLSIVSDTGISTIGFIFIFPAFVFNILAMCIPEKKVVDFCANMFSGFAGLFCLVTGIIGLFEFQAYIYVPIVLIVVTLITLVIGIIGVIKTLKEEKKEEQKPLDL